MLNKDNNEKFDNQGFNGDKDCNKRDYNKRVYNNKKINNKSNKSNGGFDKEKESFNQEILEENGSAREKNDDLNSDNGDEDLAEEINKNYQQKGSEASEDFAGIIGAGSGKGNPDFGESKSNSGKEESNPGEKKSDSEGEDSDHLEKRSGYKKKESNPGEENSDSRNKGSDSGEKESGPGEEGTGFVKGNKRNSDAAGKIPLEVGSWLIGDGPDKDIVISSRIRLARNLVGMPFPNRAGQQVLEEIDDSVGEMLLEFGRTGLFRFDLEEMDQLEKQVLVERHLISRQQSRSLTGRAAYINREQTISIMVNEEDHLRLQFISPGEDLRAGWNEASSYDDLLDERLDFAFDRQYGYLTACPTNLGTGLRASVMLHLPGLSLAGSIKKLLGSIGKFGLTFRGIYGEGSEAEGSIYQLSNQVTLGRSEEEIIDNLESILSQIKDHERQARDELINKQEFKIKDKIMRAFGVLKHAYQIDSMEAVKLISLLLLGVYYDLVPLERKKLLELLILTRPAHLQYCCSQEMIAAQRDISRADLLRRELA